MIEAEVEVDGEGEGSGGGGGVVLDGDGEGDGNGVGRSGSLCCLSGDGPSFLFRSPVVLPPLGRLRDSTGG